MTKNDNLKGTISTANIKIKRIDLVMELEDCRAIACFLSDSIGLILEEHGNYNDNYPVPRGAESCLTSLQKKLQHLIEQI
jgi:hypothetical protein